MKIDLNQIAKTVKPRHMAPLPLYPEDDPDKHQGEIKIKLYRNPAAGGGNTQYEQTFNQYNMTTAGGYVDFRRDLDLYITGARLNNAAARFNAATHLLSGAAKETWAGVIAPLNQHDMNDFDQALNDFSLHYMTVNASRQQMRFMNRHLAKPRTMRTKTYYAAVQRMCGGVPYLHGNAQPFDEMQMREHLIYTQGEAIREMVEKTDFDWENKLGSGKNSFW